MRGPLLCWRRSLRSSQISMAGFEKIMLAEISLETESNIHDMTILLFLIHELRRSGSFQIGLGIDPSMIPSLSSTIRL